jgi:hypothetical protein
MATVAYDGDGDDDDIPVYDNDILTTIMIYL